MLAETFSCFSTESLTAHVVFCSDHGLARLVEAYRTHGHMAAKINPLLPQKPVVDGVPEIDMLVGNLRGTLNTTGEGPSMRVHINTLMQLQKCMFIKPTLTIVHSCQLSLRK